MSIHFRTPNGKTIQRASEKRTLSNSKANSKQGTIESKSKERQDIKHSQITPSHLIARIEELNFGIERLRREKKEAIAALSSLTQKIAELSQSHPKALRSTAKGQRNLSLELSRLVEIKRRNLLIARNNNKLLKQEYEEFELKSSMRNELESLKEQIVNARSKKYNLIKAIKENHKQSEGDRVLMLDEGGFNESINAGFTGKGEGKGKMGYLKKLSESRQTIREFLYKMSSLKQIIAAYQPKSNEEEYIELLEAINKLFNEINSALDGTPDEIITRVESKVVNHRRGQGDEKKFINFSKSLIDLKLQLKAKQAKLFRNKNNDMKNISQPLKQSQYTYKGIDNDTRSNNSPSSDEEETDPEALLKEKDDLTTVNSDLIQKLHEATTAFTQKKKDIEFQISKTTLLLHDLTAQNDQLKRDIEALTHP